MGLEDSGSYVIVIALGDYFIDLENGGFHLGRFRSSPMGLYSKGVNPFCPTSKTSALSRGIPRAMELLLLVVLNGGRYLHERCQ